MAVSGSELSAADYVSASQSWAVGVIYDKPLRAHRTLTEQFDGSKWSVVPSPNQSNKSNGLNGVSMVSGAGWSAGYSLVGPDFHPMALRWDGTQWSLDSPAIPVSNASLTGIDTLSKNSAWTVGFSITGSGTRRTLIDHAAGTAWTQVASPNDGTASTDNTLMAISGTTATGLWAVGYEQSPAGFKPLVLRYDTTRPSPTWVSVSGTGGVPSPGAVETVLTGVDVRTASDVWAVGYYDDGSGKQPLALHWNGSTWSNSPVPGVGLLRQVAVVSPTDVWAAGTYYSTSVRRTQTLVVHFDGTKWTTVTSADSTAPTGEELIGVAAGQAGSALTVVGRQGGSPLIEQANCTGGPVSLPTRTAPRAAAPPAAPGVGPAPAPPPKTPAPTTPVPVTITDQAAAAGLLAAPQLTWSAAPADYNGDGWVDLYIGQHMHQPHLWLNNHDGTFTNDDKALPHGTGVIDRHDCLPGDFNRDGLEDLFCSVGADRGTALKSNVLLIQQPDHTFVDEAYQWNVSDPTGRGRNSAVLDVNNDGYPDIFYGTASLRPDGLPSPNRMFMNTGHGSFLDSPAMGLDLNIGSRCAHTVDYNSDGWPDLLVCGDVGGLHLFRNDAGRGFTDVSSVLGARVNAEDAVMVDVNHDSRPDLITLTPTTVAESLQRANGTFAPPKTILTVQDGRSLAVGDVNGDHNPDIYVTCGRAGSKNAPDYLLLGNATGGFATTTIPEATLGQGDRAYPIDYNHDGLTGFLVLNGSGANPGQIQLLTPQPASRATQNKSAESITGR